MAVKFRDYYQVLGVPRTAKPEDIKRAYRRGARKHHPDLKPAAERDQASEAFKEINEAYEVLSDPEKRKKYDALGENWKSGMDFTPPPRGGARGAGGTASGSEDQWEDFGDFSDFFASVFGGRTNGRRPGAARGRMQGVDAEAELPVTLEQLLQGGKHRISFEGNQDLDVEIPLGVRDGTTLRLAGRGQPGIGGGSPGDLFLRLRLVPHPRYRVIGDDLEATLPLWPWQAVLGGTVRTTTPDGAIDLKVPAGARSGQRMRLKGRGLPRRDGSRGDFYEVVDIVTPEHPTEEERKAYEALKQSSPAPPDRPAGD